MRTLTRLSPLVLAAALLAGACSDDDPTGTNQSVGVSLNQTTATISRGGTVIIPVTVSRSGGYTGAVALTAENLPTGVTATFTPTSVASGSTTSSLSLSANNTATTGTQNITIRATGSGATAGTVTLPLTVSNSTASGIALATGVTTLAAAQGAAASIPIVITRNGDFTGDVNLTVEGLPTGVTATYAQPTLTSGQRVTTLTFNVGANATASATPTAVTIRGTGTGITAQTQTVNLTVNPNTTAGFGAAVTPAAFIVTAGQSATTNLTISRQNAFTGGVGFVLEGAPAGVTATFNPTSLTGNTLSTAITIATTAATPAGTYQMTLRGTATGATAYTVPLTLIVQ